MDRTTHTLVGRAVVPARDEATRQAVVDQAPHAQRYYTDGFATYQDLGYGRDTTYPAMPDKSQTSSVEGGNADLRQYLARLGRTSRCFSRCIRALQRAVKLFIW